MKSPEMLKNYIKIALRNLFKEKQYSMINIFGLSLGTAVAILMLLYVVDEWSFDKYHSNSDRIYRAWVKEHVGGDIFFNTVTPFILGRELEANFPEIDEVTRVISLNNTIRKGAFSEQENIYSISPSLFEVFDFPLTFGDSESALAEPQQVVLSKAYAKKYFAKENPLGEVLDIQMDTAWYQFVVTGILEDIPSHSSFQYDVIIPFDNTKYFAPEPVRNSWTVVAPETYILLEEGQDIAALEAKVAPFMDQQVAKMYKPGEYLVGFQPLTDIHLNNEFPAGMISVSDWRYPYILSGIALLILILAGINFVTLAIGRSVSRAKEVGVRKVTGATRFQLMQQFWSEAIVLTLIAVVIGLIMAEVALPYFNNLAAKELLINFNWQTGVLLLSLALSLGLIAGIYPALVISGFSPILAIHGLVSKFGSNKHLLLRSLVVFQFVLSVFLISSTFIMQKQLNYLQNKNLGFNKDLLLTFPYDVIPSSDHPFSMVYEEGLQKAELLRNELAANPEIQSISTSSHVLGIQGWLQLGFTEPESQKFKRFNMLTVDYNFIDMMDIELVEGRNFSEGIGTDDKLGVILNEIMATEYGMLGKIGEQMPKPFEAFQLVGIVKDFNFNSLHNPIGPLLIAMDPIAIRRACSDAMSQDSPLPDFTLKIASDDLQGTITTIQTAWEKVAPGQAFDFSFIDQNLNNQYQAESRLSSILVSITVLAIFIACLGLFGIATLSISRRTKEIGIRKILGASTANILLLLNKSITWMVLIANIIAAPVAYYFMKEWLDDFAYQTTITVSIFLLATLSTVLIAWIAVSYQSLRAAIANPIKSLRYE